MAHGIHMFLQCINSKIIIIIRIHWALSNATILSSASRSVNDFSWILFSAGRDNRIFFFLPSKHSSLSKNILNFNFINKYCKLYQALQALHIASAHNSTHFFLLFFKPHWLFLHDSVVFFILFVVAIFAFYFTFATCLMFITHCTFVGSSELCAKRLYYVNLICYSSAPKENRIACCFFLFREVYVVVVAVFFFRRHFVLVSFPAYYRQ